jgi:BioD-like phosphotransacetylase family protein
MPVLYVTSAAEKAGKTLLCAGLAKTWMEKGKKVGFLKPLAAENKTQPTGIDKDVIFMQQLLDLKEPIEQIGPFMDNQSESANLIKQVCSAMAQEKEIVIIEGMPLNKSSSLIENLDAKVLVIHDYSSPLAASLESYKKLGPRLIGVIINKAPKNQVLRTQNQSRKDIEKSGISLLGVLPEDRFLMSMSVNDLTEAVQGKILNCPDMAGEIIENFMMGSSTFDRGPAYYSRKNNKAVILWGERPGYRKAALAGLQSAALQTSVKCIVISNNGVPIPAAAQKAEEKKVPLISAAGDLKSLITSIENGMLALKFIQVGKMPRLIELMGQNLDSQLLAGVWAGSFLS